MSRRTFFIHDEAAFAGGFFHRWLTTLHICTLPTVEHSVTPIIVHFYTRSFNRVVEERRSCSGRRPRPDKLGGEKNLARWSTFDPRHSPVRFNYVVSPVSNESPSPDCLTPDYDPP